MKQLIIVRHAKSDWGTENLKDIDRPLNERGYADAYFMSKWFKQHHTLPQSIFVSDATRALNTALIFARTLDFATNNIKIEPQIYESRLQTLLDIVSKIDNKLESVMLFGHNPGLTNLVNELTGDLYFDNISTCGIIALNFDTTKWGEVSTAKGKLLFHKFPKEFK